MEGLEVSHLQFAYDTIPFLHEDRNNLKYMLSILQVFEVVFGL